MKKVFASALLLLHCAVSASAHDPKRIVTLAPSLGELAADVLQDNLDRIVGVSDYTDYPPALKKVPSIGSYARFSLEKVAGLKPDLVLATSDGNPKDQIAHLREMGIPVFVVNTGSFSEVEQSMVGVGEALGQPEAGKRMAEQFSKGLGRIRERAKSHSPRKRVVLEVGDDPLVVMAKGSFLNDALEAVNAINVYGDVASNYLKPSVEDVIRRNPDLIIVMTLGEDLRPYHLMARRWMERKREAQVLQGDALIRPSLRLLEGLSLLERAIYGNDKK